MVKGGAVGAVFLDLIKAFDTMNHKVLVAKLSTFNFSDGVLELIKSYLHNKTQRVKVHNHQRCS